MPTWTGLGADNNWSTAGNWDTGVPTNTTTAIFSGNIDPLHPANKNCTITSGANCTDFNLTGYKGTITFTNTLNLWVTSTAGNLTLSAEVGFSMVGPNGINYIFNASPVTRSITSNGYNFDLPISSQGLGGNTINIVGTFRVSSVNNTTTGFTFNGGDLQIIGNLGGVLSGNSNKVLVGTGTVVTGANIDRLIINAPGFTRTFAGSITVSTSFTWTAGSVVATGNTITLLNMITISLGGQTFNNFTFSNSAILTCTVTGDFTLTGNIQLMGGGSTLNGTGKAFVQGNVTGLGSGGSFTVEMTGTGTLNGNVVNNVIINTSGIVTLGATNEVGASRNLTLQSGTLNLANNLTKRGGTITILPGFLFTGTGNLVFRDITFSNTTHTIVSNGVSWPTSITLNPSSSVTNTLVLGDNLTVEGDCSFLVGSSGNQAQTINGNTLFVRGNFTVTTTGGIVGTTSVVFEGSSNMNWTMSGPMANNLDINKSGGATVSISGTFSWGTAGRTLQRTAGNINPGTSTISIPNSLSVTINGMTFWNLTLGTSVTVAQNALNTIQNALTCNGNTTFTGTHGWTTNNFTCTTAASTITLQNINANPLAEYRITGLLTLIGTLASRITLQAAGSATFTGTINPVGQLNIASGTVPSIGMTISQATGISPNGLIGLLPNRPVITGGSNPTFTISPSATSTLGSTSMRAGFKAKFILENNGVATQNVGYVTTQDIDSSDGQTIYAFGSDLDDVVGSTIISLFRTLNWNRLVAPIGSVAHTFIN